MKAREIRQYMGFTYPGAFATYWAGSDATCDRSHPSKVVIRNCRRQSSDRLVAFDIRLDAEQEIEVVS